MLQSGRLAQVSGVGQERLRGKNPMVKRTIGVLVFAAATCTVIVAAADGSRFLRRPLGVAFLGLWSLWWLVIALGRRRGAPSSYNRSQRGIIALGIVALVALFALAPWEYGHFDGPIPRNGPLAWAGLGLFAAGIILQCTALWSLRGLYTTRLGMQPGHRLVTSGPYRWLRHPGYLSNLVCLAGISLALSSLIALATTVLVVPLVLRRIEREEEMLLAELGEVYRVYQSKTRRLIPRLY